MRTQIGYMDSHSKILRGKSHLHSRIWPTMVVVPAATTCNGDSEKETEERFGRKGDVLKREG